MVLSLFAICMLVAIVKLDISYNLLRKDELKAIEEIDTLKK
jgi:hypothetical protein